jgi:hypothetical protein
MVCIDFNSIKFVGTTTVALTFAATLEKAHFNL